MQLQLQIIPPKQKNFKSIYTANIFELELIVVNMPEEHYVLRCFSCETFQVHIVKKSKKWECKMCGAKQSLKRNYGKGSGKDCRLQVMRLNELRLRKDISLNQLKGDSFDEILNDKFDDQQVRIQPSERKLSTSKWAEYVEADQKNEDEDEDDDDDLTDLYLKINKRNKKRVKKVAENCYSKRRKIFEAFSKEKIISTKCEETKDFLSVPCNQNSDICSKTEKIIINSSPIQVKNESKQSKYAKYMETQSNGNDLEVKKNSNIFDSDATDLDSILNIS